MQTESIHPPPTSFVIEVDQLKTKSKKPSHLESRMQALNKRHYSLDHHRVVHQTKAHKRAEFLETRRQACADRIAKVRMIAQNHSKKLEDQQKALKEINDQKLIDGEKRRLKMMNVPRSKIPASKQTHPNSSAAVVIQKWWRVLKVGKVSRLYKKMGLSLESSKGMPFENLSKLLQSEAMTKAVGRMLVRAKRLSLEPVDNWQNPCRVFLSAYMVVSHPEAVFEQIGPNEENLQECAFQMLIDFESWMENHSSKVLIRGRKFLSSWINYYNTFEDWKSGNREQLALDLMKHFMELEKLWIAVRNQEDAEHEWMGNINLQQKQVFSRLNRLDPKYSNVLMEKRKEARDAFLATEDESDSRVKPVTLTNTSVDVYLIASISRRDSVSKSVKDSQDGQSSIEIESQLSKEAEGLNSIWSNQKLAHELVIDPDFKMKRSDVTSMEGQVASVAKKVFFEKVKTEFESGNFTFATGLIADIREMLINLLPEKSKLIIELQEALDSHLIEQQIEKKVFDVKGCLDYVTSKMLQFCAPVRDSAIKAIKKETDLVLIFEQIFNVLEDMKVDMMNYQLQSIKPLVKQQAVEYEQKKFNESLENNEITLEKTSAWLQKYAELLKESSFSRNPENIEHPDLKVSYEKVYHDAILGLLFSSSRLEISEIPETFHMDIERLLFMQNEAQALSIVAALIMLLKNIVPSLRSNSKMLLEIKNDLLTLLEAPDTNFENIALHLIEKGKKAAGTISPEQESLVRNMVEKTVSFNDGVFSLISRRMQTIIRYQMEKTTFKKESLASYGLDSIESELENLSRRIYLLANHNKQVYVNHYDDILKLFI